VVVVDIDVAGCLHLQIEMSVLREQIEHMVQERHVRLDRRFPCSVDREAQLDVRLACFAGDVRRAFDRFRHRFSLPSLRTESLNI